MAMEEVTFEQIIEQMEEAVAVLKRRQAHIHYAVDLLLKEAQSLAYSQAALTAMIETKRAMNAVMN